MPLLNSGNIYAEKYIKDLGIVYYDKDGNEDLEAIKPLKDNLANMYNALFQYIASKLTDATIHTPGNVTGTATGGAYTGVTTGNCKVKIL